jgi:hypothetical protein
VVTGVGQIDSVCAAITIEVITTAPPDKEIVAGILHTVKVVIIAKEIIITPYPYNSNNEYVHTTSSIAVTHAHRFAG